MTRQSPSRHVALVIGVIFTLTAITCIPTKGQSIASCVGNVTKNVKYLFYLHGAVVSIHGDNAINEGAPEWGPYRYSRILDSLARRGFHVISEIRKKELDDSVYAKKITAQIDTLLRGGVSIRHIVVVGASSGWDIALQVSARLKNKKARFVLMGGCWPDTYKSFTNLELHGNFLSIIEETDPHQTCMKIFEDRKSISGVKEITLHTGKSHGFLYDGYREWIDPVLSWIATK